MFVLQSKSNIIVCLFLAVIFTFDPSDPRSSHFHLSPRLTFVIESYFNGKTFLEILETFRIATFTVYKGYLGTKYKRITG